MTVKSVKFNNVLCRHKLLREIAKQHGYTKVCSIIILLYSKVVLIGIVYLPCLQVLVGDNATRLAVRLLGNIAQGRGASLPLDTVIKLACGISIIMS